MADVWTEEGNECSADIDAEANIGVTVTVGRSSARFVALFHVTTSCRGNASGLREAFRLKCLMQAAACSCNLLHLESANNIN